MTSAYKVLVAPTTEPVTVADLRAYARIDFSDDDPLIAQLISRARAHAEQVTHRALASQQIRQMFTIERPIGGELSGSINEGPNWYQYNEQLGANPFGPAQFYFDLAAPPFQSSQPYVIEYRVVAFSPWTVFPQVTNLDGCTNTYVDDVLEPARLYIMSPVTANFYRFTYWTGYSNSYPCPFDLVQAMCEMVAYWYDHREAEDLPGPIMKKLLARRVDWL